MQKEEKRVEKKWGGGEEIINKTRSIEMKWEEMRQKKRLNIGKTRSGQRARAETHRSRENEKRKEDKKAGWQ